MGTSLGRVLDKSTLEVERGPDVRHKITVPKAWLDSRANIEFELPRLLACAQCGGGGCDECGRSGAVATRGRSEPGELVSLRLPKHEGPVSVRLAHQGGLPAAERGELPRGHLLLQVVVGDEPTTGIELIGHNDHETPVRPQDEVDELPAYHPPSSEVFASWRLARRVKNAARITSFVLLLMMTVLFIVVTATPGPRLPIKAQKAKMR